MTPTPAASTSMRSRTLVLPLLLLALVGAARCGSSKSAGAVYVTVKDPSQALVADAVVTTDPATKSRTTDALGSVLMNGLAPGVYAVSATHPALGAARTAVTVEAGGLLQITLILRNGGG